MGKSLTEVAKAVLMKESAGIPEVQPNDAGDPFRGAKSSNPNMASLKPGSKSVDSVSANPGAPAPAEFQKKQDLGPAPTKINDVPGSAKAVVGGQDTSKASKSSVSAEPAKKLSEAEELEEDVEISEELEAFIDDLIAEGASEEEIAEAIEENFEIVESEEIDEEEETLEEGSPVAKPVKKDMADAIAKFKGKITKVDAKTDKKGNAKMAAEETETVDMSEDLNALFAGEELSEDFKAKAKTIFESAVTVKVQAEIARLEEAYAETLEEEVDTIKEELSNNVDDYLNYVVEQWTSENEVAIEAGLRSELTEDFISGLRNLFAEHYIDIPEDKVSIVEELGNKVEELEAKLNEEIERSVTLSKMLNESKTNEILIAACDGLTDTQVEKMKSLAESVDFADVKEYAQKISTLKESYFPSNVKSENVLDKAESAVSDGKSMIAEELSGPMSKYVQALGRTSVPK